MCRIKSLLCLLVFSQLSAASDASETLIHDTSWLPYVVKGNSKITLSRLSKQGVEKNNFKDKISIVEVEHSKNLLMSFLCTYVIPEEWDILAFSKKVHYMEPFDALALAATDGNLEIAMAAERTLPLSKAVVEGGRITDFKNKDAVAALINVDHYIALACDFLDANINACRVTKGSLLGAGGVLVFGQSFINFDWKKLVETCGEFINLPVTLPGPEKQPVISPVVQAKEVVPAKQQEAVAVGSGSAVQRWLTLHKIGLLSGGLFALMAWRAHQRQNKIVRDYLSVIDFLLHSKKFTFSKDRVLTRLIMLHNKLRQFGFGQEHAAYIRKMICSI